MSKTTLTEKELAAMTAHEYVERLNAETRAWIAEDPQNRGAGLLVCDDEWITGLDVARNLALSEYSDTYKERYGVRPRNCSEMSLEDIRALIEKL